MLCAAITSAAVFSWGGSVASILTLRPDPDAVAVLEFKNTLTFGSPKEPVTLTADGLSNVVDADCRAAHEQRRAMMHIVAQNMGARTFREICGPVEDVRRLIPGAFPGVAEGVLL